MTLELKFDYELIPSTKWWANVSSTPETPAHVEVHVDANRGFGFIRMRSFESKDSTHDPHWFTPINCGVLVPVKIKNVDKYLEVPVKPRYNPPKWNKLQQPPFSKEEKKAPEFKPPKRRSREALDTYSTRIILMRERYEGHVSSIHKQFVACNERRLLRWNAARENHERRTKLYDRQFAARMVKYEKRYALFQRRLEIAKNWRRRPRLVLKHARTFDTVDHPYSRERFVGLGGPIDFYFVEWQPNTEAPYYNLVNYFFPDSLGWPPYQVWSPQANAIVTQPNYRAEQLMLGNLATFRKAFMVLTERQTTDLSNKLLRKLYGKIRKNDIHIGTIVAERAQTLSLIQDILHRILQLKTGKKRLKGLVLDWFKSPRMIADDFLAFMFGVKPLLNDLYAASKILEEMEESRMELEVIVFRANSHIVYKDTVVSTPLGAYKVSGKYEISYVVKFSASDSASRWLSRLGLVNPGEIAWELTPWSFVLDWFASFSEVVSQSTAIIGLHFLTGTKTVTHTQEIKKIGSEPGNFGMGTALSWGPELSGFSGVFIDGSFIHETKDRSVLTELPGFTNELFIKDPLSQTHVAEAIALTVQKLMKR